MLPSTNVIELSTGHNGSLSTRKWTIMSSDRHQLLVFGLDGSRFYYQTSPMGASFNVSFEIKNNQRHISIDVNGDLELVLKFDTIFHPFMTIQLGSKDGWFAGNISFKTDEPDNHSGKCRP